MLITLQDEEDEMTGNFPPIYSLISQFILPWN